MNVSIRKKPGIFCRKVTSARVLQLLINFVFYIVFWRVLNLLWYHNVDNMYNANVNIKVGNTFYTLSQKYTFLVLYVFITTRGVRLLKVVYYYLTILNRVTNSNFKLSTGICLVKKAGLFERYRSIF